MHDALVEAGVDRCRRAEMSIVRPESGGQPPAIATPDAGAAVDPSLPLPTADRPVAVEPIGEPSPTLVLSRLWNDHRHDRTASFVVTDGDAAERIEALLTDPVGIRAAADRGRTFHAGSGRVPLAEGGYAAVPAGTSLRWRESTTAGAADSERSVDDPWLELHADGAVVTRLDGVDALDCPSRVRSVRLRAGPRQADPGRRLRRAAGPALPRDRRDAGRWLPARSRATGPRAHVRRPDRWLVGRHRRRPTVASPIRPLSPRPRSTWDHGTGPSGR